MSDLPKVRMVGGHMVTEPGVPLVWLPLDGHVIAKIPPARGNRRWLHETVGIRSPILEGDRWHLPRNCLMRLATAAADRYGYLVVCRDMSRLTRCNKSCQEASGLECQCSCMGAHHGESSSGWYEREGDVLVADLGAFARTAAIYGPTKNESDPGIYGGELEGRRYCADPAGRRGWPAAAQFTCASCLTRRARVWDHCHAHGFVRAPLCNTCNTRHWRGWQPQHGRAAPTLNLDTSYYRWCPWFGDEERPCSA